MTFSDGLFRAMARGLAPWLAALLIVARWLAPTEAAAEGETLWIAQLWPLVGLLWLAPFAASRGRTSSSSASPMRRLPFDWFDAAVGLIVLGHVVSALSVCFTSGQQRAALNLMWEWISLGLSFWILRRMLPTREHAARLLLLVVVTVALVAGVGVWQREIYLPQALEQYEHLKDELERLNTASPPAFPAEAHEQTRRLQQIERRLAAIQNAPSPLQGEALLLWEQRLRASTEPYGFFALANTLAGLLLAGALTGGGFLLARPTGRNLRNWTAWGASVLATLVMALCLVLSKSRTAWVGLAVALSSGVAVWFFHRLNLRKSLSADVQTNRRRLVAPFAAAGLIVCGIAAYAALRLDAQVLAEAPKSLRYRLEYWTGAAHVIREHPWLGVGPGNFRAHYLAHKLPQSSEEIADPHNFVLDLWASGGLLAVVGMLLLLWGAAQAARTIFSASPQGASAGLDSSDSPPAEENVPLPRLEAIGLGGACSWLAVLAAALFFESHLDDDFLRLYPALAGGWLVLWLVLRPRAEMPRALALPVFVAGLGLLVHLLGAGGIEMPAIVQLLLVLLAAGDRLTAPEGAQSCPLPTDRAATMRRCGMATLLAALLIGCWLTATAPVQRRQTLLASADSLSSLPSRFEEAVRRYEKAAQADPWSTEPLRKLADLRYRRWLHRGEESEFDQAEATLRDVVARNPRQLTAWHGIGAWRMRRFELTGEPEHAAAALEAYRKAVELYPHSARLLSEASQAAAAAQQSELARRWAALALEQDAINRAHGHADKYLSPETREILEGLQN